MTSNVRIVIARVRSVDRKTPRVLPGHSDTTYFLSRRKSDDQLLPGAFRYYGDVGGVDYRTGMDKRPSGVDARLDHF